MDKSSAALEAELASLAREAESELLHETGPGDTSVASSQLTAFLVQHGVLSPLRPPGAASLAASSSSFGATGASRPPTTAVATAAAPPSLRQQQAPDTNLSYEIVMTPERRRRPQNEEEEGQQAGQEEEAEEPPTHSPRSGISSLGLASPPHRPVPPMQWGTGGERLQPPLSSSVPPARAEQDSGEGWAEVSQLLRSEGYRTGAGGVEKPEAVLGALRQVMRDLREGREVLRAQLMERQRGDSDRRAFEAQLEGVERAGRTLNETLAGAERRARALEAEVEKAKRGGQEQVRAAKAKAAQLAAQLRQSEHRVKEREAQIDKMAAKLEALKEKETRDKEREKAVFRRLAQREPRPNEGKWVDMLGALDSARQRSAEEAEALRAEVRALNAAVKEKENYIARHETVGKGQWARSRSGGSSSPAAAAPNAAAGVMGGPGMQQLLEQVHGLEKALRAAEGKAQAATRRADALETGRQQLAAQVEAGEDERAKLKRELQNRPTLKAWRGAQKRIEELEASLKAAQEQEERGRRGGVPFRRVALSGLDASAPEELRELVGAVCRVLELGGPAQVLPAVDAMRAAMEAIPPLEAFVKDVCAFLAREMLPGGAHLSPEEALARMDLPGAQRALRAFAKEAKEAARLRRFQSRLRTIVSTRDEGTEVGGVDAGVLVMDDEQLLATVQGLVALEHQTLRSREAREAAEAYLAARPELLVNRAVQHFRYLFSVKALEGVLPKMNELYLFSAEMGSLTRALRAALGLSPTAPTNKLLAELQSLIKRARKAAGRAKGQLAAEEEEEVEDVEEEQASVDEASLLMTDLNLSTVVEEEGSQEEQEEKEEEEEEEEDGQEPGPEDAVPSISLSSASEPDEEPQQQRRQQQQQQHLRPAAGAKPAMGSGSGRIWGASPAATSRSQHPMLAVLSAAESQESPFLPARQQQGGQRGGVPESPALFVASSKLGATGSSGGGVDVSASSGGSGVYDEDSSRYPAATYDTYGRSSGRNSGYGAGSSGSLGLLGVLSAAESGGSLPSPAVAAGRDVSLSLSSDGGDQ